MGCNTFKGLNVPLTKIEAIKNKKVVLEEFVHPKEDLVVEHNSLPTTWTQEGFDPNAYKLLVKTDYNPNENNTLAKILSEVTGEKTQELISIQKMLKGKAYAIERSSMSLSYQPFSPIRIVVKRASSNDVNVEKKSQVKENSSSIDRKISRNKYLSLIDLAHRQKIWSNLSMND